MKRNHKSTCSLLDTPYTWEKTPTQANMFTTEDLPLFSGTAMTTTDEKYSPTTPAPKQLSLTAETNQPKE